MHLQTLSYEWKEYEKTHRIAPEAKSIEEYCKEKEEQGIQNQSCLETPAFASLKSRDEVENTEISLPQEEEDHKFGLRVYRPAPRNGFDSKKKLPLLIYFHGGYWVGGGPNSEDLGCRAIIARGNDILIASFSYRTIPEVSWDTMMADAEHAVLWASENAGSWGADPSLGFLVGGAEAGAHLAAAAAIRCRNKHPEVKLTGQVLIVPTLMAWPDKAIPTKWADRLKSHTDMADANVLSGNLFSLLFSAVGFPESEWHKGENFPMWDEDLHGLPPAYIPIDEVDATRDQGFLFAELLQEAGVLTRTDYYRGLPNMFVQFPELPMTAIAGGRLAAGVAWLLQTRK